MKLDVPARRTVLFVPADQPRKIERAASCDADVVVLDLEDGVSRDRKAAARAEAASALGTLDFGKTERVVRVNAEPMLLGEDLAACAGADAVMVPKVDTPRDLHVVRSAMQAMLGQELPIFALAGETPLGVLNAAALADESVAAPVVAWMWGSEDLAGATGCRARGRGEPFDAPLTTAREATVLLAAATRRQAIDTVYPYYRDVEGLRAEASAAARAGFDGKGVIHPDQVEIVRDAFTPTDTEIGRARAVVAAFDDAGAGVAVVDGQMLDLPHLVAARRTLSRAPRSR